MSASGGLDAAVGQLGRLWGGGAVAGLSEGQLLDRFLAAGDESAFAALVARHGPMVRGVCRRCLGEGPDADDAFQATFLVLVKKAAAIRDRDLLANWLYGVARRVSADSRAASATRRRHLAPAGGRDLGDVIHPDPGVAEEAMRRELSAAVQREVDGLPESYRVAVVLCDLSGCSHEEAARRLAWPVGTVKGRHFRARQMLRDRLERRGLGAGSAGLIAPMAGDLAVSSTIVQSTIRAAVAVAAGGATLSGTVPARVAALAQGVISAMSLSKLKLVAATLAVAGFVTGGAAVSAHGQAESRNAGPASEKTAATEAPPRDPVETKIDATTTEAQGLAARMAEQDCVAREALALSTMQGFLQDARSNRRVDPAVLERWRQRYEEAVKVRWQFEGRRLSAGLERAKGRLADDLGRARSPIPMPDGTVRRARLLDIMQAEVDVIKAEDELRGAEIHHRSGLDWARALAINPDTAPPSPGWAGGMFPGLGMGGGQGGMMGGMVGSTTAPSAEPKPAPPAEPAAKPEPAASPQLPAQAGGSAGGGGAMEGGGIGGTNGGSDEQDYPRVDAVGADEASKRVAMTLDRPLAMHFGKETPLEDVLKYLKQSLAEPNGPGFQIYCDPNGLQEADKTMQSTVSLELEGIPARVSLKLLLRQLGLSYLIRDGLLIVTADTQEARYNIDRLLQDDEARKAEDARQAAAAAERRKMQGMGGGFR